MRNIELSESLVNELFQNGLPNISFLPVSEKSKNIVRVVCDFGLMDRRNLNDILEKFGYEFGVKKLRGEVLGRINEIV